MPNVSKRAITLVSEKKKTILEEAQEITDSHEQDYGPVESFQRIADVASVLCNQRITAQEVCLVLIAVKLVRESYKHKRDNLTDATGYLRILSILRGDEK